MATQYSKHDVELSEGTKLTLSYCDDREAPEIILTIAQRDREIIVQLSEEDYCAVTELLDSIPKTLL